MRFHLKPDSLATLAPLPSRTLSRVHTHLRWLDQPTHPTCGQYCPPAGPHGRGPPPPLRGSTKASVSLISPFGTVRGHDKTRERGWSVLNSSAESGPSLKVPQINWEKMQKNAAVPDPSLTIHFGTQD